jgi:hypothetical protein
VTEITWDVCFDLGDGLGWRDWASGYHTELIARYDLPAALKYATDCAAPDITPRVALRKHTTEIIALGG